MTRYFAVGVEQTPDGEFVAGKRDECCGRAIARPSQYGAKPLAAARAKFEHEFSILWSHRKRARSSISYSSQADLGSVAFAMCSAAPALCSI
jgi:hypothetical protein